jgi:hypothetical protein
MGTRATASNRPRGVTPEGQREVTFRELRGRLRSRGTSTLTVLLDGVVVGTLTVNKR